MGKPATFEPRMNAEAFLAWYDLQPDGKRYELLDGTVYEMQSERVSHSRTKMACYTALSRACAAGKLPCETFADGMALRVDDKTIFEPDVMVRCGPRVPGDTVVILDPLIVVEVLSPSTQQVDLFRKFNRYFRNPTIVHYLIVNIADRNLAHHHRKADGHIETTHPDSGILTLDPPGLTFNIAELFADDDA